MRGRAVKGLILAWSCMVAEPGLARTSFEQQVMDALNMARSNPAEYARELRRYRTCFSANIVHYPGRSIDLATSEGVTAVDDTIAFLMHQPGLRSLGDTKLLDASAGDLVADQAHGGSGHRGRDGSMPGDRAERHGGGEFVAEVIAYGPADAQDAVRQLIVDDGVADRGHRAILYSQEFRFAGVSCGPHPQYRTICVIDLGATPEGGYPAAAIRTASR